MASIAPIAHPITPNVGPVNPSALRNSFMSLAMDMTRIDAKLEDAQRSGSTPTSGWDSTFEDFATRLDAARMGFAMLRPDAGEMVARLGQDLFTISKTSGVLEQAQIHRLRFSSGWDRVLDRSIADAQRVTAMLDNVVPPTPTPPVPPTEPTQPPTEPTAPAYGADMAKAVELIQESIATIRTVPPGDTGSDGTKEARIAAYKVNLAAQALIEPYFDSGTDPAAVSTMRRADASLEDANWQLAKKPSPDGRFNGVDIPGALRDSQAAVDLLTTLAGNPTT